ncbi:hypothetical protein C8T65DRAFT_636324 [Cerioporus squamosus]|nr:hypothetical protein C8T65DRAFT_636324 [Cerioporus squamosus]
MYSTLLSVALFSTLAIQGALADFTVNTVEITQCEPVQLTWADTGSKSYNVALVSSANPCDDVIAEYGDHTTNHITVTPAIAAGQKVMVSVLGDDDEGWSGEITVKEGKDTSCLPKSSSASSSAAASSTSAVASASGTTLVVNPAAAPTSASSAPAAPSSSDGATVVGAAGAGALGNGAFASVQFSASTLALSAIAAVAALAF